MTEKPKPFKSDYNIVMRVARIRDKMNKLDPTSEDYVVAENQLRKVIVEYKREFPWKGPTKSMEGYWV